MPSHTQANVWLQSQIRDKLLFLTAVLSDRFVILKRYADIVFYIPASGFVHLRYRMMRLCHNTRQIDRCHVEILRYTCLFGVSLATKIQKKRWLLYINTCFNYNLQHSNAISIVHSVYVFHVWSTDYETGTYTTNFRSEMVYWEPCGSKDVVLLVQELPLQR